MQIMPKQNTNTSVPLIISSKVLGKLFLILFKI